jgi:demethylmenaquinone methyltransferase / 2-methoxy-6-polyprenyl-1,4-benzoquinol methylase
MGGGSRAQVTPPAEIPDRGFVGQIFRGLAPRYNRVLLAYSLGQDLRWKSVLIRRLRPRKGERALDLACGTGLILGRLATNLGSAGTVGADVSRAMLLEVPPARTPHRLIQADAERLPLAPRRFDIVTAGYLLKYVELDRFFVEVARVLRPGGRFGGYDFSRPTYDTILGRLYSIYLHRILASLGRARGRPEGDWRALFEFLPRIVESSGWESRVQRSIERAGLVGCEIVTSLGGAITWVWARKPIE